MTDAERIPLVDRKGTIRGYALVDVEDAERISAHEWHLLVERMRNRKAGEPTVKYYANRKETVDGRRYTVSMHREILGLAHGDPREADHIDRDGLNNQRANLRVVTRAENAQNRTAYRGSASRFRGVTWNAPTQKWRAKVTINGVSLHFGLFEREEDAAAAALEARSRLMTHSVEEVARA